MQWTAFSLKTTPNLALLVGKCDTNQKQKRQAISGKKDYSVRNFTSVLNTAREIQDVPVNLSENIPTITETMTCKSSAFTGNVKRYWKLHNTHKWKF